MKTQKFFSKFFATAAIAVATLSTGFAQTNVGESCGCPPVGSRSTVNASTLAASGGATDGDLTAAHTVWTCDKIYILDKKIYVPDGKTLTIQPGTVIKANTAAAQNANALVVSRGGTIIAPGTQDCPIIFTAAADPLDGTYGIDNQSQWGGVVILGKATNNLLVTDALGVDDGLGIIEGFASADPRAFYGADLNNGESFDDNDNSGLMSYVSIRHGGATVGPDNELNGLTLGSVGRATTLHHIEVVANSDDGIEFFGGTVDLKYGVVLYNDDDGFDWDHGWSGRGQFWVVVKAPGKGDNGLEIDGDDGNTSNPPLSNPTVYNVTCLGVDASDDGIEAKERTNGSIYNSIFAGYDGGLDMADNNDGRATDAYDEWNSGNFNVVNCTFVGNTDALTKDGDPGLISGADNTKFSGDGNVVAASVSGLDFSFAINGATNAVSDPYDAVPVPGLGTVTATPVDGFFSNAPYRGAFDPNAKSWMSNWSFAAFTQSTEGLADCPTDINNDRTTNNSDFLILLGQFNQSCD